MTGPSTPNTEVVASASHGILVFILGIVATVVLNLTGLGHPIDVTSPNGQQELITLLVVSFYTAWAHYQKK